jgi:hypothetical protein
MVSIIIMKRKKLGVGYEKFVSFTQLLLPG